MELRKLVCELISISAIHRYRITKSASSVGLYFGQPMILDYVLQHDACTQKELAEAMHISAASIAVSIKRIEKAGLITRTPDETDSRKNHLSVTQKGQGRLYGIQKNLRCNGRGDVQRFYPRGKRNPAQASRKASQ